jgi:hypothetical protein
MSARALLRVQEPSGAYGRRRASCARVRPVPALGAADSVAFVDQDVSGCRTS